MSNHIRNTSRNTQQIFKELNKPCLVDKSNLDLILTAWKNLPAEERNNYSAVKDFHRSTTRLCLEVSEDYSNENIETNKLIRRATTRSRTTPMSKVDPVKFSEQVPKISEILFKNYYFPEEILSKLYVSDLDAASDLGLLQKFQIYSILSLGHANVPIKFASIKGGYLSIDLEDSGDIVVLMPSIFRFIDIHIKKGNVLIHCCEGKSQCCAAAVGYLMKKFKSDFKTAVMVVNDSRPECQIHSRFERQLKSMERSCLLPD